MPKCAVSSFVSAAVCALICAATPSHASSHAARKAFDARAEKSAVSGGVSDEEGDRGAIGIKFLVRRGVVKGRTTVVIEQVIGKSAADHAGLKPHDLVISVNGISTSGLTGHQFSDMIRGEPGTKLTLIIERDHQPITIELERGGLRNITDKEFRTSLTHQYEDEDRKAHFIAALNDLMNSTGRSSTFAKASPPLNAADLQFVCDNANDARISIEQNDYVDADRRLRLVLKRYPGFVEARYMLALLYDMQARFPEARSLLKQVVGEAPKFMNAWLSLALVDGILGNREDALKDYKKASALASEPKDEKAIRIKIAALQDDIANQPAVKQSAEELVAKARQLIRASDYEQAERVLKQAIAIDAKYSPAWQALGEVQQNEGEPEEALTSLEKAFENSDGQLTNLIASTAQAEPNSPVVASTIESLKKRIDAAAPTENIGWARTALGYFYARQDNHKAALEQYNKELEQGDQLPTKEHAHLLISAGIAHQYLAQFKEALDCYERAVLLDQSLLQNRDVIQAIETLRDAIKSGAKYDPNTPDYISELPYASIARWSLKKPLKVYVEPAPENSKTYRPEFAERVRKAFDLWSQAFGAQQLRFIYVSKPDGAQISIFWTDDKTKMSGKHRLAETTVTSQMHRIQKAKIMMLTTTSPERTVPLSDDDVFKTGLHEIGHALGLSAHSANQHDIMFPFATAAGTHLSDRDIRTLTLLYSMAEPRDMMQSPGLMFMH